MIKGAEAGRGEEAVSFMGLIDEIESTATERARLESMLDPSFLEEGLRKFPNLESIEDLPYLWKEHIAQIGLNGLLAARIENKNNQLGLLAERWKILTAGLQGSPVHLRVCNFMNRTPLSAKTSMYTDLGNFQFASGRIITPAASSGQRFELTIKPDSATKCTNKTKRRASLYVARIIDDATGEKLVNVDFT